MQLTVENVTTAKSGKSLRVKASGEWYGAKKDSGIKAGTTIEAEVSDGDYGKWIDSYKLVNGSAAPQAGMPSVSDGQVGTPRAPSLPPAGAAPVWSNFVSNQVAHAIQAGLITDPAHIKLWAAAAKQAFVELA
jgi:hypothetical protein